jgi:hypothetical protein
MISLNLRSNLINILGSRLDSRVVVIESDDWGSIRMASKETFNIYQAKQIPVGECPYNSNDCLESNDDLEGLLQVLTSHHDSAGNHPIFTINSIMANPVFDKIEESNYADYFFEPFTETLKRYPNRDRVVTLYRHGIASKVLFPQFHGREHVNVFRWLESLRNDDPFTKLAFSQNMFSLHFDRKPAYYMEYMDAFDTDSQEQLISHKETLRQGLELFRSVWGFSAQSFIPPCYIWPAVLNDSLVENGIRYLQGNYYTQDPVIEKGFTYKKRHRFLGRHDRSGLTHLVRNVFFEPSIYYDRDPVNNALREIEIAFRWNKPAVIGSHRLNYIGSINPLNRSKGLRLLDCLIKNIIKRWPDVQFMNSEQLGHKLKPYAL